MVWNCLNVVPSGELVRGLRFVFGETTGYREVTRSKFQVKRKRHVCAGFLN
jgi:hypothetical protein